MSMSVPSTAGKRPGGIKRKDARARPPESDEMESNDMESGEAARYEGASLPIGPIVSGKARPAASRTGGEGTPQSLATTTHAIPSAVRAARAAKGRSKTAANKIGRAHV